MADNGTQAITETAGAIKEVAKFGSKAVDAGREVGGFLSRIFGQGMEDAVALHWSDRVRARRIEAAIYDWERLTELVHKVDARLKTKGITNFRPIPPKIALALLENATVEYDDDLHTLWANLFATGVDTAGVEVHRKYVSILSELTSGDARILKLLYQKWKNGAKPPHTNLRYGPLEKDVPYDETSIITLNRLGLVAPETVSIDTYDPPVRDSNGRVYAGESHSVSVPGELYQIEFTLLGEAFCKAIILD